MPPTDQFPDSSDPSTDHGSDNEFVTLARFDVALNANVLVEHLKSMDIPAFVRDEHLNRTHILWSGAAGGVPVLVPAAYAEQAREAMRILASGQFSLDDTPIPDQPVLPKFHLGLLAYTGDPTCLETWKKLLQGERKLAPFSPVAAMLPAIWFLVHGMYAEGAVAGIVMKFLLPTLATTFGSSTGLCGMLLLIAVQGCFGSTLYYHHCARKVRATLEAEPNEAKALALLKQRGGLKIGATAAILLTLMLINLLSHA